MLRATLVAASLAPLAVAQDAAPDLATRAQAVVDALAARDDVPGVSAAFALPDGTALAVVAGVSEPATADREAVALTAEHRLLTGSVGKIYVTAAAHRLAREGKLDLGERPAIHFAGEAWFDALPNAESFTVRQLLRHQSGLPRYVFARELWETLVDNPDRVWDPRDLLGFVADDAPLFPAGQGWSYSDTNYLVVGLLIERLGGQPYYAAVREHLLAPHGLDDTVPTDTRTVAGMAQGHVVVSRAFGVGERTLDEDGVFTYSPQFEWCGGGYATTPSDLARFTRLLYSGALLGEASLDTLLDTVPADALGEGREYGLGVITTPTELGEMVGHDGFMPGYLTCVGYLPDLDVAVAVQVNTDDGQALGRPLHAVVAELLALAAPAEEPP